MFLHQQALAGAIPPSQPDGLAETIAHSSSSRAATLTGLNLDVELGREHALEDKIANLAHKTNLGREVGQQWGLEDVMRWQNNWVSQGIGFEVIGETWDKRGGQGGQSQLSAGRSWSAVHGHCTSSKTIVLEA